LKLIAVLFVSNSVALLVINDFLYSISLKSATYLLLNYLIYETLLVIFKFWSLTWLSVSIGLSPSIKIEDKLVTSYPTE
jgi:hypothetical protein